MLKTRISLLFLIALYMTCYVSVLQAAELHLEGVVEDQADSAKSLVIIDGNFYKLGDKVGNLEIKQITPDYVKLFDSKTGAEVVLYPKAAPKAKASPSASSSPQSFVDTAKKYMAHPEQAVDRVWELTTLRDLAIINNAAVKYYERNKFFPVKIRSLLLDGFLPDSYASEKNKKYQFSLTNTPMHPDDFQLHADPLPGETGLRHFFVGPDAVIREAFDKPADANSPVHQYFKPSDKK